MKVGRIGEYLFCLMFVGIGIFVAIFRPSNAQWWVGPAFVAGGLLLMLMLSLFHRGDNAKAAVLKNGIDGRGTVTAVKPTTRWESNDIRYFRVTMTIEVPGRAPYEATTSRAYHRRHWDAVKPGIVVPVRVHQTDPSRVEIAPMVLPTQ